MKFQLLIESVKMTIMTLFFNENLNYQLRLRVFERMVCYLHDWKEITLNISFKRDLKSIFL